MKHATRNPNKVNQTGRWKPPRLAIGLGVLCCCFHLPLVLSADERSHEKRVTEQDLPRILATEPAKALETFQLAQGFKLELVAAEPMVADPVDACFDEYGRMYVAEMHGYPFSQEPTKMNPSGGGKKDAGIIRLLEDTDGDGKADTSTVFVDKISWPTSVCFYNGGLFVLAPQYLYYFKDTDGDHKADVREVILQGFGRDNVQTVANNLKWALDNRIYFATGGNPADIAHRGKHLFFVRGHDMRFNPATEKFEQVTGGGQFGHSMDDWGNRFVCSNSDHIQHVIYRQEYLARNPYLAVSHLVRSIAKDGASARVYRTSPPEPWRVIRQKWRAKEQGYTLNITKDGTWQFIPLDPSQQQAVVPTEYPVGYFTSATGITIYRGDAYPPEFQGNAFVGDVGGNLVHRKIVRKQGATFSADRADNAEEFIRSTDNWFRPVNFVNAPDGTLYVLDMYRETVEHPRSIPQEIKQFLHLQSGSDRGRIYRIVSPGTTRRRPPRLGDMTGKELVSQLESKNSWNRETAQRLLWERQDKSVAQALEKLIHSSDKPLAKVHALYTLSGLGVLKSEHLERALSDAHPRVREHAVRLSEPYLKRFPKLADRLLTLCDDSDDRIRFQVAFSLGEVAGEQAMDGLFRLASDPRNGSDIRAAILSSVTDRADQLAVKLMANDELVVQEPAVSLLSELGLIVGANPNPDPAARLLSTTMTAKRSPLVQQVLLTAIGEGLRRRGSSFSLLLAEKTVSSQLQDRVRELFDHAALVAGDHSRSLTQRVSAIGLLAFADFETAAEYMPKFLTPQVPQAVQRAAVAALAQQQDTRGGNRAEHLLVREWRTYSPQIRRDVVDALLQSESGIHILLAAVDSNHINHGDLERDKKQFLMNHPDSKLRVRSRKLFGGEVNSNREAVVAEYRKALDLKGDVTRGREVFGIRCAVCHRVGDVGHPVAPDLVSVQNKSPDDLLVSILDPNRDKQPQFDVYSVLTDNGKVFSGMIVAETANSITLRRAEGKEDVIFRTNIEEMVSSEKSLMPEGLEKELSHQDLADVIAFVKSIKPDRK